MSPRNIKAGSHRLTWSDDRAAYVVHNSDLIVWWDRRLKLWTICNEDHIDLPTEYAPNRARLPAAIDQATTKENA